LEKTPELRVKDKKNTSTLELGSTGQSTKRKVKMVKEKQSLVLASESMVKQMKKKKRRLFEDENDVSLPDTPITNTIGESEQKFASNQ
jgi:hypothetical protein